MTSIVITIACRLQETHEKPNSSLIMGSLYEMFSINLTDELRQRKEQSSNRTELMRYFKQFIFFNTKLRLKRIEKLKKIKFNIKGMF